MVELSAAPPALSTPATHNFRDDVKPLTQMIHPSRSPEHTYIQYEVDRTVAEIKQGKWRRIALQFPDGMLPDAPTVFEQLSRRLHESPSTDLGGTGDGPRCSTLECQITPTEESSSEKLFILGDTSYGACCVDEIAAEHVDADVVVHYGRACLSPTARLPVIHIFTKQPLAIDSVIEAFTSTYQDHTTPVVLMSDVTYASHLQVIGANLMAQGYSSLFTTDVLHDPASPLPNRTVPEGVGVDHQRLRKWHLFHISTPPDSLLLTLSSRVFSIHVYSTASTITSGGKAVSSASATVALRRRYALLTSVSTVPVFGILINTLSVKNYLHILDHVQASITAAGKKSYTFVVGKINAAKVANFSEIGAWVVIGCWESSLVESKDFWKPILTPFELELALARDEERVWTGEWESDFQSILEEAGTRSAHYAGDKTDPADGSSSTGLQDGELDSEPESAPPEYDLRSGRYVSQSRPMLTPRNLGGLKDCHGSQQNGSGSAIVRRPKGDIVAIGNQASPGAEYLQSKRSWKGLGSDMDIEYDRSDGTDGKAIEEGRSGIARGYRNAQSIART
ncbi:MAG: hypothetical protein Q9207_002327 [Kuettlingeria erythrocarpa]